MGFFSGILDAITSPVASIFGSALGGISQERTNDRNEANAERQMEFQAAQNQKAMDFNHAQGEIQRNWQTETNQASQLFSASQAQNAMDFTERMSGTAYRRAVNDMRAAGINPMLAVSQGGASSPPGSAGSGASSGAAPGTGGVSSAGSMAVARNPLEGVSSAVGLARSAAEVQNIVANRKNIEAQTSNIEADTRLKRLTGDTESYRPQLVTSQSGEVKARERSLIEKLHPEIDKLRADADVSRASAEQIRSQNLLMKDLMANPVTRPFAPLLNLIFK